MYQPQIIISSMRQYGYYFVMLFLVSHGPKSWVWSA